MSENVNKIQENSDLLVRRKFCPPTLPDDVWRKILSTMPFDLFQFNSLIQVNKQMHELVSEHLRSFTYLSTSSLLSGSCTSSTVLRLIHSMQNVRALHVTETNDENEDCLFKHAYFHSVHVTQEVNSFQFACGTSLAQTICSIRLPCLQHVIFSVQVCKEDIQKLLKQCPTINWISFQSDCEFNDTLATAIISAREEGLDRIDIHDTESLSEQYVNEQIMGGRIARNVYLESVWGISNIVMNHNKSTIQACDEKEVEDGTHGHRLQTLSLTALHDLQSIQISDCQIDDIFIVNQCDQLQYVSFESMVNTSKLSQFQISSCVLLSDIYLDDMFRSTLINTLRILILSCLPNVPSSFIDSMLATPLLNLEVLDVSDTQTESLSLINWNSLRIIHAISCTLLQSLVIRDCSLLHTVRIHDCNAFKTAFVKVSRGCEVDVIDGDEWNLIDNAGELHYSCPRIRDDHELYWD